MSEDDFITLPTKTLAEPSFPPIRSKTATNRKHADAVRVSDRIGLGRSAVDDRRILV